MKRFSTVIVRPSVSAVSLANAGRTSPSLGDHHSPFTDAKVGGAAGLCGYRETLTTIAARQVSCQRQTVVLRFGMHCWIIGETIRIIC